MSTLEVLTKLRRTVLASIGPVETAMSRIMLETRANVLATQGEAAFFALLSDYVELKGWESDVVSRGDGADARWTLTITTRYDCDWFTDDELPLEFTRPHYDATYDESNGSEHTHHTYVFRPSGQEEEEHGSNDGYDDQPYTDLHVLARQRHP
jgi:hypothetical protein